MVGVMVVALILLLSRNELLFDELVAVPNSDARRAKRRGHEPDDADADADAVRRVKNSATPKPAAAPARSV